jgi:hypothetical protein
VAKASDQTNRRRARAGSYVVFTGSGIESVRPADEQERTDRITQHVSDRVKKMLIRIESDLDKAEEHIGEKLHLLDTDNDGVISKKELEDALKFLDQELTEEEMQQLQVRGACVRCFVSAGHGAACSSWTQRHQLEQCALA